MRTQSVPGALAAAALFVIAAPSQAQSAKAIKWSPSFKSAMAAAKTSNKLVMADFYTEW
jgi:hypothetical protein